MKTYLYPVKLRRGQPIITAVEKKNLILPNNDTYWLVTYSDIITPKRYGKVFKGLGSEYKRSGASRISKELYDAFILEAKTNRKTFA